MKQNIALRQLDELPLKSKVKLREWCIEQKYCGLENEIGVLSDMQLSIGQMIEFLGQDNWGMVRDALEDKGSDGFCDALWEAVKHELSEVGE